MAAPRLTEADRAPLLAAGRNGRPLTTTEIAFLYRCSRRTVLRGRPVLPRAQHRGKIIRYNLNDVERLWGPPLGVPVP